MIFSRPALWGTTVFHRKATTASQNVKALRLRPIAAAFHKSEIWVFRSSLGFGLALFLATVVDAARKIGLPSRKSHKAQQKGK